MNIRRYVAADMRSAFKLVRDELGPDVVILSTRRVRGQIELTVAIDTQPVGSATPLPAFAAEARPSSPERTATERSSTERFAMETVAIPASVNQAIDGELRQVDRGRQRARGLLRPCRCEVGLGAGLINPLFGCWPIPSDRRRAGLLADFPLRIRRRLLRPTESVVLPCTLGVVRIATCLLAGQSPGLRPGRIATG